MNRRRIGLIAGLAVVALPAGALVRPASAAPPHSAKVQHVLLLSVDGLHQADLAWYVSRHPASALATLVHQGSEFTNARTPVPSDSFPGMVGQVTGGNPSSTGVYYDDTWNAALLPAGTTSCAGATPGVEVTYFEQLDRNQHALDAGQGLSGLPDSILRMTGRPQGLIDPSQLPVDPSSCTPVYPHQYLRVNTVFEVARQAGLGTAWSDKHPAYEILDGPSGTGVQDLFTPEINSDAAASGNDWTTDNGATRAYDAYKVQAVLNEIRGYDHSGTTKVGVPAIFGMNFQAVSTAEKLPTGGYYPGGTQPTGLLQGALGWVDGQVAAMLDAIKAAGLRGSTVVILSAKHGQSPLDPTQLTRIDDGPIIDALNTSWRNQGHSTNLVAFAMDDDGMLLWLTDRSSSAVAFAKSFLLGYGGTGNDVTGASKPFTASGLSSVQAGPAFFGIPSSDAVGMARVPDLVGIAQVGTVYTGGKKKIAEHGGANPGDRDVPLVFWGATIDPEVSSGTVETTQIAPTILSLLGLDPSSLQAVQLEHTAVLSLARDR